MTRNKTKSKNLTFLAVLVLVLSIVTVVLTRNQSSLAIAKSGNGFDQFGYNYTARLFNGTGWSWCQKKGFDENFCRVQLGGPFLSDKLVMKWTSEWDRGNVEGWSKPPYLGAWTDNEWNGMAGGSKTVWHYKIVWVGSDLEKSSYWRAGGYGIWGQFEVVMDQGVDKASSYPACDSNNGGHSFCALAVPSGYGSN